MIIHSIINLYSTIYIYQINNTIPSIYSNDIILKLYRKNKKYIHRLHIIICLKLIGLNDKLIYIYNKPFLKYNKRIKISISHSNNLLCLAISKNNIGVDIQFENQNIIYLSNKFINYNEKNWIYSCNKLNILEYIHIIWGLKESLFKLHINSEYNFKKKYRVHFFNLYDYKKIVCWKYHLGKWIKYVGNYMKYKKFYISWVEIGVDKDLTSINLNK